MDILEKCHQTEQFCIELIIEFFACLNFQNTLNTFKQEIQQSDFILPDPFPSAKERIQRNDVPLLMNLLDSYEHTDFFEKWSSLVPEKIRSLTEYKKLTIYLYTYYATLKYRNNCFENWDNENLINKTQEISRVNDAVILKKDEANLIQKLEKTNGTFIIEKTTFQDVLPKVDPQYDSDVEKQYEIIAKDDDEESSNREFEADSLENESDSNNDTDITEPIRILNSESSAMDMFKNFLSENGTEFTNDPEFLPFFALPFVENPKLHPTFTKVFEENWLDDLKQTLEQFLINYSCGDIVIPRVVQFCLKNDANSDKKEDHSSSELEENVKRLKEVRRKLHRLKKDHQKLVGVATELSSALEKSVQGETVNLKSTLTNCIKIFPDLFSTDVSTNQQIKWHTWESNNFPEDKKCNYNQIDLRKIKHDLIHGSMKNKLLLLQALRWYITKSKSEEREHVISWFCRQDMLGLKTSFITDSLAPVTSPHPVQQSVVRILNALASFNTGRDYIASSKITVQLLIDTTKQNDLDSVTEDMVIATLQKLSLRRRLSDLMIKNGVLEWLLAKLDPGPLKKYSLEYSTSLIMNLAICVPPTFWNNHEEYIQCLIKLLRTSHNQVLEFVCGSFCCIVRSDVANTFCKNNGFEISLTECLNKHKGDVVVEKQIETLIKLHHREIAPETLQMNSTLFSDDDLEDPEELESEIDENDLVKGSPSGEKLLSEHYRLVFTAPSVVGRQSSKSLRLILRPSSPRTSNIPSWARSHP